MSHALIFIPAVGFVLAAGAGVLIRSRRAREDKGIRDGFTLLGKLGERGGITRPLTRRAGADYAY